MGSRGSSSGAKSADALDRALVDFAKKEGIAYNADDPTKSMVRWIGSGSLSDEQLKRLSALYDKYNKK